MKQLLTVMIATAFAGCSTLAIAQPAPAATTTSNADETMQQSRSRTFGDTERVFQQESRSSASNGATTGAAEEPDKAIPSGDRKKDFAEQERTLLRASESSASRHDTVVKTPALTREERRAIQDETAKARARQSQP